MARRTPDFYQTDPTTCNEWFRYLQVRYQEEVNKIKDVPAFEYKIKPIASIVFAVCKQFVLDDFPEIKFLALKYLERLIEQNLSKNASELSEIQTSTFQKQMLYNVITCVQLATKNITAVDAAEIIDIKEFIPDIHPALLLEKELGTMMQLLEHLASPNTISSVEVILSCINLVQPKNFDKFMATIDKVLMLVKLNRFQLFSQLFEFKFGKKATTQKDLFQIRIMFRDDIFVAANTIFITAYLHNLNVQVFKDELEKLTKIRAKTLNYFAKLVLKGIADTEHSKSKK